MRREFPIISMFGQSKVEVWVSWVFDCFVLLLLKFFLGRGVWFSCHMILAGSSGFPINLRSDQASALQFLR